MSLRVVVFLLTLLVGSIVNIHAYAAAAAADDAASASFTAAASASSVSAADEFLRLLNNIHSMRADFTQTTLGGSSGARDNSSNGSGSAGKKLAAPGKGPVKAVQQKSSGKMALLRPGKFRWEVLQPVKQVIIANGRHIWVYDVDLEQVTKQVFASNQPGNPAQLLSGDSASLRRAFNIVRLHVEAGMEVGFELRPSARNSSSYSWIQLFFDHDGRLLHMRMEDNLGQKNQFDFSNLVANGNVPASLFTFVAPPGVDVIDNGN
jgi:outer membrane lipoprotein carrier protein